MDKFSGIKYERPDFDQIRKQMENAIASIKKASTFEEVKKVIYDQEEASKMSETMMVVASIRNTMDTSDTFYDEEMQYIDRESAGLMTLSKEFNTALLATPFRKEFDEEFGKLFMQNIENQQKLLSDEIINDRIEESDLCREYSKAAALCKTDFRGEECNFYGLLRHMQSTDRAERKEAFEAWAALYESVSGQLDEIYDKLVAIRVRMSKKLGFNSYTEMAYTAHHRYDYTAADVKVFRDQVRDVIVPACVELREEQKKRLGVDKMHWYDEMLVFPDGNAMPQGTKDEMVAAAQKMYRELSNESGEFFDFMVEHDLFDLETKPNKHMGGYCTFLPAYKAPFIFSNFNGTSADVDVLTHEAGHSFEAYLSSRENKLSDQTFSTSEINEIHSMSMELFTHPWMELFFGENANKYRFAHLEDTLTTIPYLVSVDEFQHRVFEKPDMTAKERRAVWHEIEQTYLPWRDYEGNKFLEEGGFWMQKQHIFLYPFYYVDYALAQLGAFDFFAQSKQDKKAAWDNYVNFCKSGGSRGYFETLEFGGLHNPFKQGSVQEIIPFIVAEIENEYKNI